MSEELWPVLSVSLDDGDGKKRVTRGGDVPRYIVGFEGVEEVLKGFFEGEDAPGRDMDVRLKRVWDGWNGAFNEDWRRRGRVVVWDTGVYSGARE